MKRTPKLLKWPYWVLIVDNDGMLADAYERIIEQAGGKPISVGNDRDAKTIVLKRHVDIVLMDVCMPKMGDMRLLEWMGAHVDAGQAIVVLSNHDDIKNISRAYEVGADRYVLKAKASPNDLIRVINETLAQPIRHLNRWHFQY